MTEINAQLQTTATVNRQLTENDLVCPQVAKALIVNEIWLKINKILWN